MPYTSERKHILKEIESCVKERMPSVTSDAEIRAHDWKHAFRVRRWALKIAKGEGYKNPFLVEIASLLHDIGRLKEKKLQRTHAEVSGIMVKEYVRSKKWLSEDELQEVLYAITNHSREGKGMLVHILQDADRLDGFGAMGIIRNLRSQWHLPDYDPLQIINPFTLSPKEVDTFFAHHIGKIPVTYIIDFFPFILTWYDRMNTKTGKELATPLVEYTKEFLEELKREAQGVS